MGGKKPRKGSELEGVETEKGILTDNRKYKNAENKNSCGIFIEISDDQYIQE